MVVEVTCSREIAGRLGSGTGSPKAVAPFGPERLGR